MVAFPGRPLPETRAEETEVLVHTEIEIDATAERVWEILADFEAYPEWNPLIPSAEGCAEVGTTARIRLAIGKLRVPITVEVLCADPGRELSWVGPAEERLRRVGRGTHFFRIHPIEDGRVRFEHGEEFEGLVVPRRFARGERLLGRGYAALNRALKRRAEV
jgi:hypothetical protein